MHDACTFTPDPDCKRKRLPRIIAHQRRPSSSKEQKRQKLPENQEVGDKIEFGFSLNMLTAYFTLSKTAWPLK